MNAFSRYTSALFYQITFIVFHWNYFTSHLKPKKNANEIDCSFLILLKTESIQCVFKRNGHFFKLISPFFFFFFVIFKEYKR